MVLCACCNTLVKSSNAEILDGNTYTTQYICNNCNSVDAEEIAKLVNVIKNSKNKFKQSLVKFYNENGFLTQKQVKSIKLTVSEEIQYYINDNDFNRIFDFLRCGTLSDAQEVKLINVLNDNNQYELLKRLVKYNIQSDVITQLLNDNKKTEAEKMENKIIKIRLEKINGVEFLAVNVNRVNRRKKTYKNIKKYASDIVKNTDMDILYISIGDLVQNIADVINVLEFAEDVNIYEYIPEFIQWAADDTIIDYIYNLVGRNLGFHNNIIMEPIAEGPAAEEIKTILNKKSISEKKDGIKNIYTLYNNCCIELITNINDNDNIIYIYDGHGALYKKIEGAADILTYINKIDIPAAQDVDQENKIYYIDNIVNTLNNISIDNYTMTDGGRGTMYKLNEKTAVILTPYDADGRAYDEIIDAAAVHSITLDLYINGSKYTTVHGAENISEFIPCHILPLLQGPAAEDLEALRWEYENNIQYIINDISGRVLYKDDKNNNLLFFRLKKEAEILELYTIIKSIIIIKGYANIINYVNKFIADNFTPCNSCGATGEHWDGVPCKVCAGTGLILR